MLRSAFTAFFRSFTRHPLYALLNLLGLAFGIAAFITLSLFYHFETGYESWSPERAHIYVIAERVRIPGFPYEPQLAGHEGLLDAIKAEWPQTDGTGDMSRGVTGLRGAETFDEQMEQVDPNFLTFFRAPLLRGDAATALTDPSHVVVSAAIARKYFGTVDAVGHTLRLKDGDRMEDYTVSAVIADLPKNSTMRLDILCRLPRYPTGEAGLHGWTRLGPIVFLKFKKPADAVAFTAKLPAFVDRQAAGSFRGGATPHKIIELSLVPLADLRLPSAKLKAAIASLGLVGVLALGLALINYVNLATARAGLRAREVAVRKTLGAPPPVLRLQFLFEALLTLLLAFLMALSAVELTLPLINAAGGLSLGVDYRADGAWILELLGCVLAAGLAAALYPAFVLSAFKPAQVLASSRTPAGGRDNGRLRAGLAMLQFVTVVTALILMSGFMLQIHHMETADLGFQRDHLLIIDGMGNMDVTPAQRQAFMNAVATLPAVRSASISDSEPGPDSAMASAMVVRPGHGDNPAEAPGLRTEVIGPDYFRMLGTRLLAGRALDPRRAEDQMPPSPGMPPPGPAGLTAATPAEPSAVTNVVISRGAVRLLGFASPRAAIGQTAEIRGPVVSGHIRIVGVVEDVRFSSPTETIPPKLYALNAHPGFGIGMVRYQGVSEPTMRRALDKVWRRISPNTPLAVEDVATKLDPYYRPERNRSHLFALGTAIAALIGCIGLYGMAAFNASRRVREIGMRKVLGASQGQMMRLLLRQFLQPVALASLIAWPLGWLVLKHWLSQFDDVIAMPLWVFPSASAAAVLIALVTVAGVAFAAAGTEPGKALRHE